ncbi:cytochrome C oxidase subunit IV family protein [Sulfurimonas marina]|uniref:Cytochrome C oxidase subunit IV family protein n=1 Tax=Sulfurimonas marina TaxID=2590551 RepID=A0A7M1AVK4_9BACT|nr:cytochrome C oxidase subunit IV family protein [Sulfurimonas marina]QOP41473.1 hypothetical protein FJR03_06845 [Sulfurimonas marina]
MKRTVDVIWINLLLLSLASFLIGKFELSNISIFIILLISIFIKGELVIDYFMGLKDVDWRYRSIPILWLVIILLLIFIAYYLPEQS